MEKEFKHILRELMDARGFNQVHMSELLGCRQSQISNWLNGKSLPSYLGIKNLCEKLNITPNDIVTM